MCKDTFKTELRTWVVYDIICNSFLVCVLSSYFCVKACKYEQYNCILHIHFTILALSTECARGSKGQLPISEVKQVAKVCTVYDRTTAADFTSLVPRLFITVRG